MNWDRPRRIKCVEEVDGDAQWRIDWDQPRRIEVLEWGQYKLDGVRKDVRGMRWKKTGWGEQKK